MLTARPLVQEQHAHISVRTAPQVCPTAAPTQGAPTISIGVPEQDLLMCRFANQIQGSFTAAPAVQPTSQNYQRVSSELYFRMAFPLWYLLIAHCCLPAGQELWAQLLTATLTQHSRGKMHFHRKNGFQQRPRSNLQISCLHLASSSQTSKRALPSITKQNGCTQAAMAVPSSPALLPPRSRPQPVSHTFTTEPDLQPLLFQIEAMLLLALHARQQESISSPLTQCCGSEPRPSSLLSRIYRSLLTLLCRTPARRTEQPHLTPICP